MITQVPFWVRDLVPLFYKNPVTRFLLRPIYHLYGRIISRNRNRLFRKNGIRILKDFDSVMIKNGIFYSVFAGTLLGAIREKGLLKHDLDLDTVMFNNDYSEHTIHVLESEGFKLTHSYLVDNGKKGREETYEKDGVSIDIFYVYEDEQHHTYLCDFYGEKRKEKKNGCKCSIISARVRRIEIPVTHQVVRAPFEDIEVNVIKNADEYLKCRYGEDYMTPNPNYRDKSDNPYIYYWNEIEAEMIEY